MTPQPNANALPERAHLARRLEQLYTNVRQTLDETDRGGYFIAYFRDGRATPVCAIERDNNRIHRHLVRCAPHTPILTRVIN